jgi:hypothetical protein
MKMERLKFSNESSYSYIRSRMFSFSTDRPTLLDPICRNARLRRESSFLPPQPPQPQPQLKGTATATGTATGTRWGVSRIFPEACSESRTQNAERRMQNAESSDTGASAPANLIFIKKLIND